MRIGREEERHRKYFAISSRPLSLTLREGGWEGERGGEAGRGGNGVKGGREPGPAGEEESDTVKKKKEEKESVALEVRGEEEMEREEEDPGMKKKDWQKEGRRG